MGKVIDLLTPAINKIEAFKEKLRKEDGEEVPRLQAWESVEFPWGGGVRHRKGRWVRAYLSPDGQEINLEHLDVELTDEGIYFYEEDE